MDILTNRPVDVFTINHFVTWYIIGQYYPKRYDLAFVGAVLWELGEVAIIKNKFLNATFDKYWLVPREYWHDTLANATFDVIFDMAGYALGSTTPKNNNMVISMTTVLLLGIYLAAAKKV